MCPLRRISLLVAAAFGAIECGASNVVSGEVLLGELHCTACHLAEEKHAAWISPKAGPRLADMAARVNPDWVRKYLAAPHAVMRGTSMPDLLHNREPAAREAAADELTHFLFSASGARWKPVAPDKGAVARGESLFHRIGCVACHAPQTGAGEGHAAAPLPRMEEKWNVEGLRRFLRDPLASRPSGRMPAMALSDGEAFDLAHYLLRGTKLFSPLEVVICRGRIGALNELDTAEVGRSVPVAGFFLAVPGAGNTRLQVRFRGWLRVDTAGDYTFHLGATDGAARIALDDHWIEDEGSWRRDRTEAKGTLHLAPGWHSVKLDFVQRGRD